MRRRFATAAAVGATVLLATGAGMAQATTSGHGHQVVRAATLRTPVHPALTATFCNGVQTVTVQVDKYLPAQRAWAGDAGERVTVQARLAGSTDPKGWFTEEQQAAGNPPAVATTDANGSASLRTVVHSGSMEYRAVTATGVTSAATRSVNCTQ